MKEIAGWRKDESPVTRRPQPSSAVRAGLCRFMKILLLPFRFVWLLIVWLELSRKAKRELG